jgi:hypothetical protein
MKHKNRTDKKKGSSDITLPVTLGLLLSVTVAVIIFSSLSEKAELFTGTHQSNYNDVVTNLESFADNNQRGEFVTRRYLLKIDEDDAILGINKDTQQARFEVNQYQGSFEDRSQTSSHEFVFNRPAVCSDGEACLCFCDTVSYQENEISCESVTCNALSDVTFADITYLKKYAQDHFIEITNTDGIFLGIYDFGREGTNVLYTQEGARLVETKRDNSFMVQWIEENGSIAVCDYANNWYGGVCTDLS